MIFLDIAYSNHNLIIKLAGDNVPQQMAFLSMLKLAILNKTATIKLL
jgi:hypothetical protein